jgi:hypothetical protein
MLELALREAAAARVSVCFREIGTWERRPLLAEFDPRSRTIAIDARVVAGIRARNGEAFAQRFAAFAIWHELHHLSSGTRDERAAHDYATERTGIASSVFERAAREMRA